MNIHWFISGPPVLVLKNDFQSKDHQTSCRADKCISRKQTTQTVANTRFLWLIIKYVAIAEKV